MLDIIGGKKMSSYILFLYNEVDKKRGNVLK